LTVAEQMLIAANLTTAAQAAAWREEAETEVDEAVARVTREPEPDPADEDWCAISTRELEDQYA
jgi:TPP-dependent pyruvate/acetoin dehydrogenase alpha subunit